MNALPVKRDLTLAYSLSLAVAALMTVASAAGLVLGFAGLYGADPRLALGVIEAEAGLLLPGFLGQDIFNLVVGVPLLLGSIWLARRGFLTGLLLWPGVLFYVLYWYVLYLVGTPFSVLFLLYVPLVTLSAYATIALVSSIDGEQVRQRLAGAVPARVVGGILIVLALLTLGQDATGAFIAALAENAPVDPAARPVWISDLVLEVPAVLIGGVLLWRRHPLGYVVGAGLLFQYGLTPVGLVASMVLRAVLVVSPLDVATIVALLVFGVVCFAPLAFFVRGVKGFGAEHADARNEPGTAGGASDDPVERIKTRIEHEVDTRSVRLAAALIRLTKGRIARLWRRQVLLLTTRGRKSGNERTIPLQFFPDGDDMIVVAANSGLPSPPGWYFNLTADPLARIEVGGRTLQVRAEELSAEEAAAFCPRVLQVAPDYSRYSRRTSRRIPMIRLVPVGSDERASA